VLEVLDDVGDVDVQPIDARRLESLIEHQSRWSDER